MLRRTKIVATLGPATDDEAALSRLLSAGANVVRLNFSHGSGDEHRARAERVRRAAADLDASVGILGDLQGPKIRIESFAAGAVDLEAGQAFALDADLDPEAGDAAGVGLGYRPLVDDVTVGDLLLLDDGAITLEVTGVSGGRIETRVENSGRLSSRKGLNLRGGGLSAAGLTEQDYRDIELAAEMKVDFLAVSFVRSAADIEEARARLRAAGGHARIVAKIERAEAVADLEAIIEASDVVMVARGDLAVEIGDPELPAVQKRIIAQSREMNRTVITATQMMESMIEQPTPTRAEVLDVANAVLDGTDAVMLSAETAVGAYAVNAVAAMGRICVGAENGHFSARSQRRLATHFRRTDEAIAMATTYTARHMRADAIIALTDSGHTAMLMSRQDVGIPIYALTRTAKTCGYLTVCRGVYPLAFEPADPAGPTLIREAVDFMVARGDIAPGDRVLVTKGDMLGPGGTNTMKIVEVSAR
ncbi:pyruvate kinase [Salinisphaera sp. P385]|uniref:Pyruvate kinase n=1 Tax=Spectribacter acetivorans TaxID=3075603 RepID=A0ABU3B5H1_9GAMM|nr:pyruvate kinase [Salinisphaera sp. P385]MDT0617691.1 pyruvate kinase [Salinisphaera sp. P385]